MSEEPLVEISHVSKKRRKSNGEPFRVLDDVGLRIRPSEVLALIGPSGSGKSTFLRLLNRLEDPDEGEIRFRDRRIDDFDPLDLRRQIGLVTQKPYMFPGTVRDNLLIAVDSDDRVPAADDLEEALETCAAESDWLDQPARKLSVGQQQRVSLARILLNRPRLLLLDEPTSALDPETAEDVLERLRRVMGDRDLSIVLVSHDQSLARRFSDRVMVLRDGRITDENGGALAED